MKQHPAKYNDKFSNIFIDMLSDKNLILDPFAGTGKLSQMIQNPVVCLEIEPDWATGIIGDATRMPFKNETFDAICTSPTYGNRMADHFKDKQPEKHYRRNTYTHVLGHDLNANNSGKLQWGTAYRYFHTVVWNECNRVLKPNGSFILNIKDHIRNKEIQNVTDWHISELERIGFDIVKHAKIQVESLKHGANQNRVDYESIILFKKS
jgi:DNA modification methylase